MSMVDKNHPEWQTRIACTHCKTEQTKLRKDLFVLAPGAQSDYRLPSATPPKIDCSIVCCFCSKCNDFIVIDLNSDGWLNLPEYQTPLIDNDSRWYW